jgi:hypothetical protein
MKEKVEYASLLFATELPCGYVWALIPRGPVTMLYARSVASFRKLSYDQHMGSGFGRWYNAG